MTYQALACLFHLMT